MSAQVTHGTVLSGILSGIVKSFTPPASSDLRVDATGCADTVRQYESGNLEDRGQFDLTIVREAGVQLPVIRTEGNLTLSYAARVSPGAGTVSVSGTAVTGVGTSFAGGDVGKTIVVGKQAAKITAVGSATSATISPAFAVAAPAGSAYKLCSAADQSSANVRIESVTPGGGTIGSTDPLTYSVTAYVID